MLIVINLGEKTVMDNANPAEADKLFEDVPWEAWEQVTATSWPAWKETTDKAEKKFGITKQLAQYFLTLFSWNENDGWKPKRKNE